MELGKSIKISIRNNFGESLWRDLYNSIGKGVDDSCEILVMDSIKDLVEDRVTNMDGGSYMTIRWN